MDIEVLGRHQEDLLAPNVASRIKHRIMREIFDFGNNERLDQRKLDDLGYVKCHSCFINDTAWIKRLRSGISLSKSLDETKKIEVLSIAKHIGYVDKVVN